jgi:acetylornithine deacetylase
MKGFLACALSLVPEMLAADLKRPIVLAMSYDEEVGCEGAPPMIEAMQAALPPLQSVIVGEPTEMRVVTGHKASWGFVARVRGHEVHSSLIHTGVSAVMTAARLVSFMSETMAQNARDAANGGAGGGPVPYDPNYTTLHVGVIEGGTAHNITARDCRFTGEVRILPHENRADWRRRIEDEAARLEAEARAIHPDAAIRIETQHELPACRPESDGAAETLARALSGDNGSHVVSYMTEAGQFQDAGLSTVVCGPGSIAQAHQPDEFIALEQLEAATEFMRGLVRRLSA